MHVPGVSEVGVVTTVHWTFICKNAEREKSRWRRERCKGIGVLRERIEWREPMLKMFPQPKRTSSGRGHAIVFVIGGCVPVLVLGQCWTVYFSVCWH